MGTAKISNEADAIDTDKPLWPPDCEMIEKILDFAWIIQSDPVFSEFDGNTRRRDANTNEMPGLLSKIIFGTGHTTYFSRVRTGKGPQHSSGNTASPGLKLLKHFFNKTLTDVGGKRLDLAFENSKPDQQRIMARCYAIIDEHPALAARIVELLEKALADHFPAGRRRPSTEVDVQLSNQPWTTPLWEGDFQPDPTATRRFLRGGEPELSCIREGTVARDELDLVFEAIRDGQKLFLIEGGIASGRGTLLRQIAMRLIDEGYSNVFLVKGAMELGAMMGSVIDRDDAATSAILCDDVYWPSDANPHANMLPAIQDWIAKDANHRSLVIATVRSRYLPQAKNMLHWNNRNIDQSAHAKARKVIRLSGSITWEKVLPILQRFEAFDDGVNIEEAQREFERSIDRGPWIANYAATRAGGLSGRFNRLVDEARAEGWLPVLAAIVTVNRNTQFRANEGRRWLEQPWRSAIEWLLQPDQLACIAELIPDGRDEAPSDLSDVIDRCLSGELSCEDGTGSTAKAIAFRHPLVAQVLDEKVFGWNAKSSRPDARFKARKLDHIIELSCFLAQRKPSADMLVRQSADLICSQNHFMAELAVVRQIPALENAHIDEEYPDAVSLNLKFANRISNVGNDDQAETLTYINGRASNAAAI